MNLKNNLLVDDHYNSKDSYESQQKEIPVFVFWKQLQKFGSDIISVTSIFGCL